MAKSNKPADSQPAAGPGTDNNTGSTSRILIVDDHELMREGLASFVVKLAPNAEVIAAATAAEALNVVETTTGLDLVLLDLKLPDADGLDVLKQLVTRLPDTPVAVMTASESSNDIAAAYQAGAKGYLFKSSPNKILQHALTLVLYGETYIPWAAAAVLGAPGSVPGHAGDPDQAAGAVLSPRQQEVLALMAEGLQNKAISARLEMPESTVKAHVKGVLQKLRVNNRTHAVVTAVRLGLVSSDLCRSPVGEPG